MSTLPADRLVTLIDYGGSNIRSVQKAFEHIGARVEVTADPARVRGAKRLVLPGVGAFGPGIAALRERGLDQAILSAVARGVPLLGICLGMQFLFDESEEMGLHAGLGLLHGRVLRFQSWPVAETDRGLKVPHMGWNSLNIAADHPLLAGMTPGAHAYFVHSYYCAPKSKTDVLATSDYGGTFAAVAGHGSIFGVQFHPEKSQRVGLQILENYTRMEG